MNILVVVGSNGMAELIEKINNDISKHGCVAVYGREDAGPEAPAGRQRGGPSWTVRG
jgi:RNA-binding protein YhbY